MATTVASPAGPKRDGGEHRVAIDSRIGRYVIDRQLGAGGMGVVYLARDPELDRRVAIKLLRPELRESRDRLLREGQAVARLVHPNVVTVFDVGDHGEDLFIAMEYVPGETLGEWLATPRPWRAILDCFVEAGRGLAAAHRAGVIHRDFKPDNVLRSDDGRVVVSDFGLAFADEVALRPLDDVNRADLAATRTAGMVGTPAYMSPEQFRGQDVDARADQFSFCVALWEALFGGRPFEVRTPRSTSAVEELAAAVLSGAIQPPKNDPGVPRRIMRALRRGLSVDRNARFPTMNALLAALSPGDRRVWLAGGGAVLALGAVAFLAGRSDPADEVRVACVARATGRIADVWGPAARAKNSGVLQWPAEEAAWFDTIASRWSDASRVACAKSDRPEVASCLDDALERLRAAVARGERDYYAPLLDPRACVEARPLVVHELRAQLGNIDPSGAIGPDGALAFAGDDGLAAMFEASGAPGRTELLAGVDRVFAWSADGATIVARAGDAVVRIDAKSGERTPIAKDAKSVAAASPDGLVIARVVSGDLRVEVAGQEALRAPTHLDPDERQDIEIAPGGGRVAMGRDADGGAAELFVGDLATGKGTTTKLRLHAKAGGVVALAWIDDRHLALGGSNARDDQEGLWAVELDDQGRIDGPPTALVSPRPNTIMDVVAVRDRSALMVQVDVVVRLRRFTEDRSAPLPGLIDAPLWGADESRGLLLLGERGGARVVRLDGALVERGTGDGEPVLRAGRLFFATAQNMHLAFPLDRMQCGSGGGCLVSWIEDDVLRHSLLTADGLGPAFEIPLRERGLDPAPDGKRGLFHTEHEVGEYEVATRKVTILHRESVCTVDHAVYTPGGDAAIFATTCEGRRTIWRRWLNDNAKSRVLERLPPDVDITHLEALAAQDVVYRTVEYQSRLVRVDGLPLAPSPTR